MEIDGPLSFHKRRVKCILEGKKDQVEQFQCQRRYQKVDIVAGGRNGGLYWEELIERREKFLLID